MGHQALLIGTLNCFCSYIPGRNGLGHAFIPLPVLQSNSAPVDAGPCTQALNLLGKSLTVYSNVDGDKGKSFEQVVEHSLLLYARSNGVVDPSVLCCKFGSALIMPSGNVNNIIIENWTDISQFPSVDNYGAVTTKGLISDISGLITRLNSVPNTPGFSVGGAIFTPTFKYNIGGDVYCLFTPNDDCPHYTLLVIQCKDWFKDESQGVQLLNTWAQSKKAFPLDEEGCIKVKDMNLRDIQVKVIFLLFTSNPLQDPSYVCADNEGLCDVHTMRDWLPTAGYACESGQLMRSLFTNK